jgi:pimeloyl-ACP methyl ester carboxylesterase
MPGWLIRGRDTKLRLRLDLRYSGDKVRDLLVGCHPVSTPRSLHLPDQVRPTGIQTARGTFAALEAQPAAGVCERQPALLIPGYTGSKEDFLPVLQPLATAGRRVVAIDMRGQYESQGAADRAAYAADELAADIAAIARQITGDDSGVHLLGHSLGGIVARQTMLARTARITSLTLLGSGPASIAGQRAAVLRQILAELDPMDAAGVDDVAALDAKIRRLWDEHLGPQAEADGTPEHILAFLRERTLRNSPVGLIVMGRYLLGCPDRTGELAELGAQILVIYGENDDAWPPSVQDRMAKRLKAQRVCIPGAAHSPAVEAPETTASTLTAFWNSTEWRGRRRPAATGAPQAGAGPPGTQPTSGPAGTQPTSGAGGTQPTSGPGGTQPTSASDARPSQGRRGTAAMPPSGQ